MKLSRDWLSDYIDLTGLTDAEVAQRMTGIGHAVEAIERHGDDTVFEAEITTNRIDSMSHLGMARELAAALGRDLLPLAADLARAPGNTTTTGSVSIRIDAPEMCRRYSGLVIRGVTVKPSPEIVSRRLEAVGLRPINNVVDVTNYVMLSTGHPLHAFDLDKLADATIVVRRGKPGEKMKSLDGQTRDLDPNTVVIADSKHPVALGGIIGGAESEIGDTTTNVLLECAWFDPSTIRRTARRLGIKTDASYRYERSADPNDTTSTIDFAGSLITAYAGGTREPIIDVVAVETKPKTLRLRSRKLQEQSAGVVGDGYALELFRRLGFGARTVDDGIEVVVPTGRSDVHEEMDLVEEVLRFFGLNRVPAEMPRVIAGDARPNPIEEGEDAIRGILVGSGLTEAINYSFIHPEHNPLFSSEQPVKITNALTENIAAMRLSLLPGLLETAVFNRSYGTRDGALFEVGRTYHRSAASANGIREHHRAAIVMYGAIGTFWGDPKRPVDFFDVKGVVEQIAAKLHVELEFTASDAEWLKKGKRAVARHGDHAIATIGFLAGDILQRFGIKGDVAAAEIDIEALLASTHEWKMAPVPRYPGVPMILALTHSPQLEYRRLIETIRSLDVPYLHEVGLRDRFVPEGDANVVKTTLGMWYQAFDRSLTQEEVGQSHQQLAARVAGLLPVQLLS
ncbi:MAG: phenylalanyl-tRNA synthetase, beta subunit, non-spirochete bacterial [Acidobacteria bacterium]|nr:phenylalanyl-tRNA synthetase, beta subunit, non-spirochete bacterial [Acidobacteriota bacterium]